MVRKKWFYCLILAAALLLLTGCADEGGNLTLLIKPDGEFTFSEVNLLHLVYIPIVGDPVGGLVVRTCPQDLEDDTIVGHSYYAPSEREKGDGLQFIVITDQAKDPEGRALLEDNYIYIAPDLDALFIYLEAWHVNDIDRRRPQVSFAKEFKWIPDTDKQLLYANNAILRTFDETSASFEFTLLSADPARESVTGHYWVDGDHDLFGSFGTDRDCLDRDIEVFDSDGANLIEQPGCAYHPFAPPDGCMSEGYVSCDCQETTPTPTATHTQTLTPTVTITPTLTPTLPTATPSPTPTPSPTYDLAPMRRATYSPAAQCPIAAAAELPDFQADEMEPPTFFSEEMMEAMRMYLNKGGSYSGLARALREHNLEQGIQQIDLTRDGVPEIILSYASVDVMGCIGGRYEWLLRISPEEPDPPVLRHTIADLNGNQIPDLVVETDISGEDDYTLVVRVLEWDGVEFIDRFPEQLDHPLLEQGWLNWSPGSALMYEGKLKLGDVDFNGTIELVLEGGAIDGLEDLLAAPPLTMQHTWMWTGSKFDLVEIHFSKPTIKVHAAYIGDVYSLLGDYQKAIKFYQQSIFDSELLPWNSYWIDYLGDYPTVEPGEVLFPEDYRQMERIEMYSRFRMLLVNHLLEDEYAVETQLESIRGVAEEDTAGAIYAELALVFEDAFHHTRSVAAACQAAIQFAGKNADEILSPLGWGVYGKVIPSYDAEDICPFTDDDLMR